MNKKSYRKLTPEQRQRYYKSTRKYIEKRKAAGLCVRCGEPNDNTGKTYCYSCSYIQSITAIGRRDIRRLNHQCVICHKKLPADDSHKTCPQCRLYQRERNWRKRYGMTKAEMLKTANTPTEV